MILFEEVRRRKVDAAKRKRHAADRYAVFRVFAGGKAVCGLAVRQSGHRHELKKRSLVLHRQSGNGADDRKSGSSGRGDAARRNRTPGLYSLVGSEEEQFVP